MIHRSQRIAPNAACLLDQNTGTTAKRNWRLSRKRLSVHSKHLPRTKPVAGVLLLLHPQRGHLFVTIVMGALGEGGRPGG